MKDPTHPDLPRRPSGLTTVPTEPIEMEKSYVGVIVDLEVGDIRETPKINTLGKGTPTSSILSPTFSLELVGVSSLRPRLSTTTAATGMIMISHEF